MGNRFLLLGEIGGMGTPLELMEEKFDLKVLFGN